MPYAKASTHLHGQSSIGHLFLNACLLIPPWPYGGANRATPAGPPRPPRHAPPPTGPRPPGGAWRPRAQAERQLPGGGQHPHAARDAATAHGGKRQPNACLMPLCQHRPRLGVAEPATPGWRAFDRGGRFMPAPAHAGVGGPASEVLASRFDIDRSIGHMHVYEG